MKNKRISSLIVSLLLLVSCLSFAACAYSPIKVEKEELVTGYECYNGLVYHPYVDLELKNTSSTAYSVHLEVEIYFGGELDITCQEDFILEGLQSITLQLKSKTFVTRQGYTWGYKITKLEATEITES